MKAKLPREYLAKYYLVEFPNYSNGICRNNLHSGRSPPRIQETSVSQLHLMDSQYQRDTKRYLTPTMFLIFTQNCIPTYFPGWNIYISSYFGCFQEVPFLHHSPCFHAFKIEHENVVP